jgi:hypothetical protein
MLVLAALALNGQTRSKRLILHDGSFQSVKQWQVKKDRVRYFSSERFVWEELPYALVDWKATEKYNQELEAGADEQSSAQTAADRQAEEAESPSVAPGLKLPPTGGIFLLDSFQGKPQLIELVQNGSDINKETGKNILRSIINPLPNVKQSLERKGGRARIQSHSPQPAIYVNVAIQDEEAGADGSTVIKLERFNLVRVRAKLKDK